MGLMTARDLSDMPLTLEDQISIHFRNNCYPPVPLIMVAPAVEAIDAYWELDFGRLIELPQGVEFKNGQKEVPASQIIYSLRLEAWTEELEDDDFEEFGEV